MADKDKTQFRVIKNGPLEITGRFTLKGSDGKKIEIDGPIHLCRCGDSSNKPFCDGKHCKVGSL